MLALCMADLEEKLTKEYIQALLARTDRVGVQAVGRALVLLNQRQTTDEQASKETHHHNAQGFSPYDAELGTDMANFFQKTGFLTPKQMKYWQKPNKAGVPRISKYWRQILEDARAKHGITQPEKKKSSKRPRPEILAIPLAGNCDFPTLVSNKKDLK